jgi:hypothetical protein
MPRIDVHRNGEILFADWAVPSVMITATVTDEVAACFAQLISDAP